MGSAWVVHWDVGVVMWVVMGGRMYIYTLFTYMYIYIYIYMIQRDNYKTVRRLTL